MGVSFEFEGTERFVVQRQLGVGGMGIVYQAFDRERNTRVALKTLRLADPQALYRFKQEFRALQDIEHPNLVSLGELFEESGRWFFTMELVDGCDFIEYVRPDGALDEARLRAALGQLAAAVVALHDASKVHRDIKPSNVRVTPHGRVVLLDFGLVAEAQPANTDSTSDPKVVGTAAYMAPEQAASKPPTTAADWYAVGAVLYEALAGTTPFHGPALQIFMDKQKHEPPPPSEIAADLPADLDALCRDLLRFDPADRPPGRAIVRRLGADAAVPPPGAVSGSFTHSAPFVGRDDEMAALRAAFADTRAGRAVTVFVHGESGVGKSALIRHFADDAAAELGDTVELVGRCYERESVPYKAFDGVVDALSRYVRRLSDADAAALLPRHAALLARVFPILGRVEAIAQAPQPLRQIRDPHELRSRAFGALRELMLRIAEAHPLILVIDDLQWADADSLLLLGDLIRPPDAPPLLLLISSRDDEPAAQLPGDVRTIAVEPFDPNIARELATLLLERAQLGDAAAADAIAAEAAGHPLYIDELVRHAGVAGDARRRLHLSEAIWERVGGLPDEAAMVLELVCAADAPLPQDTVQAAARLDAPQFARAVALLRVSNLVRGRGRRGTESVEPYHDRVRRAVLDHLDGARRGEHERRLAIALEAGGAATERPELLLRYLEATGQSAKASRYAVDAARRATSALAFDNAVAFYRTALRLGGHADDTGRALRLEMAEALINAGRGALAAEEFLALVDGASAAGAIELQRRAATEYLRAGHIDTGLDTLTTVLSAVGLRLARTSRRAIASLALRRAHLRLRGLGFKRRDSSQISEEELRRIDICWTAAVGLGMADTIRGADFQTRHLLLALRAGEPFRIARALSVEIAFTPVGRRGRARAERIIDIARALTEELGNPPELVGWVTVTTALADYQSGNFVSARENARKGVEIFREQCTGVTYELASAEMVHMWAVYHTGQLGDLARTVHRVVSEAQRRGDQYALTALRSSVLNSAWLLDGDIEGARRAVDEATELLPTGWFHLQHYWALVANTHIDLYCNDGLSALGRVRDAWPELERSQLLRLGILRIEALCLRARAALAAARHEPERLRDVERDAKRIERERVNWADALAAMMYGEIAAVRGDRTAALHYYRRASKELREHGLELYAAAARRRRGELIGGAEGREMADKVDAWFREQGTAEPVHFARMIAPVAASD